MLSGVGTSSMRKAENADGLVSFVRSPDGGTVNFVLNYRDPEQRGPVEQTRQGITVAVDALRDKAMARMREIVDALSEDLQAQLSDDGRHDDFVDPAFEPVATAFESDVANGELAVRIKPYVATITDTAAQGHADTFLAEEYVRAIVRRRIIELTEIFEELRRDLLSELHEAE